MRSLFKHIKENREEITLHIEEQSPEEYRNTHPHIVYRADVTIFNTKDFRDIMNIVFSDPYVPYHVKSKLKEKLNTLQNP